MRADVAITGVRYLFILSMRSFWKKLGEFATCGKRKDGCAKQG